MARFSRAFLDDLLDRVDLVRFIDARIPLKKKGKDHWACCPFHAEKTASFSVSGDKQIYYCFGCHAHGNALDFLIAQEQLSFPEAVERLAEWAGVPLPEPVSDPLEESTRPLRALLDRACALYVQALADSPIGQEYWASRGLTSETIGRFGLGYAPESGQLILSRLGQSAQAREQLLAAGVLGRSDQGRFYERFRGRVIFPIRDGRGRLCGLAGRSLDGREPKYLNSPETSLYHKAQLLYGLDLARDGARRRDRILLVEGYLDVISLHQAGLDYAVAASGTALGEGQLETLFRSAREVVLCFDGDRAGRQAARRALTLCPGHLRPGRLLRVLFLPEGEDPDSLVRRAGADAFEAQVTAARPALDVWLEDLQANHDLSRGDELAQFLREAKAFLVKVADPDLQQVYLARLAQYSGVRQQLDTAKPEARPRLRPAPQRLRADSLYGQALVLFLLYPHDSLWQQVRRELLAVMAEQHQELRILHDALEFCRQDPHLRENRLYAWLKEQAWGEELYAWMLRQRPLSEEERRLALADCVQRVNHRLSAERGRWIGRAADQLGIGALSPEERLEILRLTRARKRPKG